VSYDEIRLVLAHLDPGRGGGPPAAE